MNSDRVDSVIISQENQNKMDLSMTELEASDSKEALETDEDSEDERKTNYWETLMHVHKSNTGPGIFSMGDAFKNAGLLLAPGLIVVIGCICVYCQHMMLKVCDEMAVRLKSKKPLGFEETSVLCFRHGHPWGRKFAVHVGRAVNVFICITQSGFCCVYMVFISTNLKQVWDSHLDPISLNLMLAIALVPMILLSWVQDLKRLAPVSIIANVLISVGIVIVLSVAVPGLPSINERRLVTQDVSTLPLFFGSVVYTFEGIGLVTHLKKRSKRPDKFAAALGPLNVAMSCLALIMIALGFLGYLRWGDDVEGSLTLNLDQESVLAQVMKCLISLGVLFSYPLQLSPAITNTYAIIHGRFGPFRYPLFMTLLYRTFYTLLLFTLSEVVPHLALFISLVGAVSSTALALIFPPLMDLATFHDNLGRWNWRIWRNGLIILFGLFGFITGTYYSMRDIIETFQHVEEES